MTQPKSVGWFSSPERWFQTRRSVESYHEHHGTEDTAFYVLLCGSSDGLDIPPYVRIVTPHEMNPWYVERIDRVGIMGGFPRCLIVDHMLNAGHESVMAFDGDTEFFDSLDDLWEVLEFNCQAIATPHRLYAPPRDGKLMCLEQFALCGNYNVGFVGFANTPAVRKFVLWWMRESIDAPECNMSAGRFAEQGWYRFVGDYLDNVHICRDQGINYAFWRYDTPSDVVHCGDGSYLVWDAQNEDHVPLRMFHYGALDWNNFQRVAVHHSRCEAGPGLMRLFEGYRSRVGK